MVSGIALVAVLLLAFPSGPRRGARVRVHPIALARLLAYVVAQLVTSNVLVAREILSPRSRVRTGVLGYRLQHPSDSRRHAHDEHHRAGPGTMTVDVTHDPPMLYVHFLLLSDVDDARAGMIGAPARRSSCADGRTSTERMTQATFVVLLAAAVLFTFRLCVGPSLADRVVALNGLVLVGMGAIATHAADTGDGAFLPALVAIALVGPISNGMIARFIERNRE